MAKFTINTTIILSTIAIIIWCTILLGQSSNGSPVIKSDNNNIGDVNNNTKIKYPADVYPELTSAVQCACERCANLVDEKIYWPVCGSDGVTYPNKCEFRCYQQALPDLQMVKEGECTDEERKN